METCLPGPSGDPPDVGWGSTVPTPGALAGLAGLQGSSVADGQRGALGGLAPQPFLLEFGGQVQVINVFQGLVALPEDVAGQPEEEDHGVDADDGEDVPGGTGPVGQARGPGGGAAVPPLRRVPQQAPQGRARPGLVAGSPSRPLGH